MRSYSTIDTWHVFVAYQIVNIFAYLFNCYGRWLPTVTVATLYVSLISFFVILVAVPAKAPTHNDAKFIFATFINNTGWSQSGIAFIVGLISPNWGFSCLDTVIHVAEEVHQPERIIPIGILGTVVIGFLTSFTFSISMMASLNNFDAIVNTPTGRYIGVFVTDRFNADSNTGAPILELFYQALQNKVGAVVLEALVIGTGLGCQIACHTWQSRLCWSFARDHGLPFSNFLSKVHPRLKIPMRAHFLCCTVLALLGCLYLGSSTAMNRFEALLFK